MPNGRLRAWDSATAPLAASARQLDDAAGRCLDFASVVRGDPRAVGTLACWRCSGRPPGGLVAAWAQLFDLAIRLAEAGFPVSPRLHALLALEVALLTRRPILFFDAAGRPWPVGHRLRNLALAAACARRG